MAKVSPHDAVVGLPWSGEVVASSTIITPSGKFSLAASATPPHCGSGVDDEIECNALLIRDGDQIEALVITIDVLYVGNSIRRAVLGALAESISSDRVFLFASHTHNAPATDGSKPKLGAVDPDSLERICRQIVELCLSLFGEAAREAIGTVRSRSVRLAVNRRQRVPLLLTRRGPKFGAVVSGSARRGIVDQDLKIVVFSRVKDGIPLAVLWSYACHPVGYPRPERVSSHYVGIARAEIRRAFGNPELPVLFLQGFSGDLRPRAKSTMKPTETGWRRYLQPRGYGSFTPEDYRIWSGQVAREVVDGVADPGEPIVGSGCVVRRAAYPRTDFIEGSTSEAPVTFASLSLGGSFSIIGVSAEPVVSYAIRLRRDSEHMQLVLGGCMDDVFGYAPTSQMLKEGGYEVDGFCLTFDCQSVAQGVDAAMMRGFRDVMP